MRFLFVALLFSQVTFAADTCKKIDDCSELVTRLTGVKYLYSTDLKKDQVLFQTEIELNAENADVLFSEALSLAGYSRVPANVEKVMKIINARDVRYAGDLPNYSASKAKAVELPKHSDYIMLTYQGIKGGEVGDIARNIRPLLGRWGRVIDMSNSQLLVVVDTAANVRRQLPIILEADVPLTPDQRVRREQRMKRDAEQAKTLPVSTPKT